MGSFAMKTFALSKTSRGILLGLVLEQARDKRKVMVSDGRIEVWRSEKVLFSTTLETRAQDKEGILEEMRMIESKALELAKQVDVGEVWDILADEPQEIGVEDISALVFQDTKPEHLLAIVYAIALDNVYFKRGQKEGYFVCASRQFVHDAFVYEKRQKALNEIVYKAFVAVSSALSKEPCDLQALETGVRWLRDCALGKDCEEGKRLVELLWRGEPLHDLADQAFQTLVALGHFHEDEILSLHRLGIPRDFPPRVLQEAEKIAQQCVLASQQVQTSRGLKVGPIAIDDPWTTEVDDALMLERDGNTMCVHIMIADPSAFVPLDSAVALEAHSRAETLYLPTGKITMFPPVLSEGVLSLSESTPVPVLDLVVGLEPDGKVLWFDIRPSWTILEQRLTYDEVDRILETKDNSSPYFETLSCLNSIAQNLRKRRREAGAIIIQRDEVCVRVENGEIKLRVLSGDSPARQLVQEFMILACTQAGMFARQHGIPVVYRKQDFPDIKDAGKEFPVGSKAWRYRVLRTMKKAELSSFPEFHYGMGVLGYTQVTSPLRRFQDFVVHVQLKRFISGKEQLLSANEIVRIFGEMESRKEELAQVEREAKRYFLLKYLKRFEGHKVLGEVIAVENDRVVVELSETLLEVGVRCRNKPRIGEQVALLVQEVNPRQDRLVLKMV